MSRVVIPEGTRFNAYHLLKLVSSYREDVLEIQIRRHVKELFPDFYVIPFKKDIASTSAPEVIKRPDLAMIDRKFRSWGVIEAEVVGHGLTHVLEQVEVFLTANYNSPSIARYIREKLIAEDYLKNPPLRRISKLIAEEQPKVLVVADEIKEDWRKALEKVGAELCSFELYKNTKGVHLFRTDGPYPIVSVREAHVRSSPLAANLLEVTSPFDFKKSVKNRVTILYQSFITEWELIVEAGKKYLRFAGGANPLLGTESYVIFADKRERYYFRRN